MIIFRKFCIEKGPHINIQLDEFSKAEYSSVTSTQIKEYNVIRSPEYYSWSFLSVSRLTSIMDSFYLLIIINRWKYTLSALLCLTFHSTLWLCDLSILLLRRVVDHAFHELCYILNTPHILNIPHFQKSILLFCFISAPDFGHYKQYFCTHCITCLLHEHT